MRTDRREPRLTVLPALELCPVSQELLCFLPSWTLSLPGQPGGDFTACFLSLGHQGKGPDSWGQEWKEPPGRASPWGVELDSAAAEAPTGPWQGAEGALLHHFLPGMGCPLALPSCVAAQVSLPGKAGRGLQWTGWTWPVGPSQG